MKNDFVGAGVGTGIVYMDTIASILEVERERLLPFVIDEAGRIDLETLMMNVPSSDFPTFGRAIIGAMSIDNLAMPENDYVMTVWLLPASEEHLKHKVFAARVRIMPLRVAQKMEGVAA